ncbi:ABC transporter substrate-binding protein [Gulosibacter molinativorax]|uniref:Sugar ABC transporter substrate-binding protein n=1 Tax=Gulosibacter molinativorax TaxID=256821 RepID=A0ABT7C6G3_9MICO|nr:ABC transporter substrate-binding protein [Gulosibacter molinativorax]MDJ1370620.1 sugar ABC transporter substrate-binding protein [Gulosibacter molinativorax]QUY61966.1 ABC transporter, substrate-binding protein [Gulosibacter molinativorax]
MKRTSKFLGGLALVAAASLTLAGCAGGGSPASTDAETGGAGTGESYKIGISQLVQHPALDAAAAGFQQAFTDAGLDVEFDVQNANGEQATAVTIANTFASDADMDLVLAIATPAAQAAAQAITDKPVLFTAVTDPVSAELVASNEEPGGNVTGTNDMNPVADQIKLIQEIVPDVASIGVVYSSGEVNSQIQVDIAKETAAELGIDVKEATITAVNEIPTALQSLGDVDAIYVPTDNMVVSGFETVVQHAEQNKIALFAGDTATVERGAIGTLGLNYEKLGQQTGEMAVKILTEGADPATMPVESQTEFELFVSPSAAEAQGVELPQAVLDRADTVIE